MSEETKWEREAGIFASFLDAAPDFAGARIANWIHNRNDSPDILCTDSTGSRIGVEMTEWLDEEQTCDFSRWEQILSSVRFPADWTVTVRLSPFGRTPAPITRRVFQPRRPRSSPAGRHRQEAPEEVVCRNPQRTRAARAIPADLLRHRHHQEHTEYGCRPSRRRGIRRRRNSKRVRCRFCADVPRRRCEFRVSRISHRYLSALSASRCRASTLLC